MGAEIQQQDGWNGTLTLINKHFVAFNPVLQYKAFIASSILGKATLKYDNY